MSNSVLKNSSPANKEKISDFLNRNIQTKPFDWESEELYVQSPFDGEYEYEDNHLNTYCVKNSYLNQLDVNQDDNRDDYDWDIDIGDDQLKETLPGLWKQIWQEKINNKGILITGIRFEGCVNTFVRQQKGFTMNEIAFYVRKFAYGAYQFHDYFKANGHFRLFIKIDKKAVAGDHTIVHIGCDT